MRAKDLRPFHIAACSLCKMLQFFLSIGVQSKGCVDINDLLTDQTTTIKCAAVASKVEMETPLHSFVHKHKEDQFAAGLTSDLYKNKGTGIYYINVLLSLID